MALPRYASPLKGEAGRRFSVETIEPLPVAFDPVVGLITSPAFAALTTVRRLILGLIIWVQRTKTGYVEH